MNRKLQDQQLNTISHHNRRKMLCIFFKVGGQRSRSYCHIVGNRNRIRCMQDTDLTESSRILQLGTIDHNNKRKMSLEVKAISKYHLEKPNKQE